MYNELITYITALAPAISTVVAIIVAIVRIIRSNSGTVSELKDNVGGALKLFIDKTTEIENRQILLEEQIACVLKENAELKKENRELKKLITKVDE